MRPIEGIFLLLLIVVVYQFIFQEKNLKNNSLLKILFSIFVLHFFLEHTRWQMIPAYTTALIVILFGYKKFHLLIKGALILLLIVSLLIPIAVPVIKLPKLNGPYEIGSLTHHWIDHDREEWFTHENPDDNRQLMVQFWYPGIKNKKGDRSPYLDK